jgi:predicted RNase H-like HicB family nuclease
MKALVIIEKDENGFGAFTESLQTTTLIGEGKTVAETKEDLMLCYKEVLASYQENGESIPEELRNLEFEYKYDISAMFNVFDFLNISKFAKRVGISPGLMRHYKVGDTYISGKQAKKIQDGLHQIAMEFLSVSL